MRQGAQQILTFAGGIVLARTLVPAEFGLFAIATFVVGMIATLGSFGLVPSLIQRRVEVSSRELQTGFTIQLLLAGLGVVLLWFGAPWLASWFPKAGPAVVWLIRALALDLVLSLWRSMSALQLERRMDFRPLAWIETAEALAYLGASVGLALAGFGSWSLVWAVVARGVIGATLVYFVAPWPVRLRLDGAIAKELLRYGLPFQFQALVNQASSWVSLTFVAVVIGPQAVGYLGWASSNGRKPHLIVDNAMRVAFPHFSRIQDDRVAVESAVSQYLSFLLLPAAYWFVLLLVAGPALVAWVYTTRWLPAVPALILFAASLGIDTLTWVLSIALNSTGRVNPATAITGVRTLLLIGLTICFVRWFGYLGVPSALLVVQVCVLPLLGKAFGWAALGRCLAAVAWLVVPTTAAALLGAAAVHLGHGLGVAVQALLSSSVVTLAYAGIALASAPRPIRVQLLRQLRRLRDPRSTKASAQPNIEREASPEQTTRPFSPSAVAFRGKTSP